MRRVQRLCEQAAAVAGAFSNPQEHGLAQDLPPAALDVVLQSVLSRPLRRAFVFIAAMPALFWFLAELLNSFARDSEALESPFLFLGLSYLLYGPLVLFWTVVIVLGLRRLGTSAWICFFLPTGAGIASGVTAAGVYSFAAPARVIVLFVVSGLLLGLFAAHPSASRELIDAGEQRKA